FVALHGSIDDVDSIAAQHQVDKRPTRTLPALDLVLTHRVHEVVLLARTELAELAAAVERLARVVDGSDRSAIEVGVGRANIEDARFEQLPVARPLRHLRRFGTAMRYADSGSTTDRPEPYPG